MVVVPQAVSALRIDKEEITTKMNGKKAENKEDEECPCTWDPKAGTGWTR